MLRHHRDELLPATLDFAAEFDATLIIIFSFSRGGAPPGDPPGEVLECLYQAAERTSAAGMSLAIETEEGFWADTGERSAQLVRAVGHTALGINWDPGNSFCAGDEPYPEGYAHVRELVRHVHFKDARREADGEPVYALEGEVDWAGQIAALVKDGYRGHVSIETHLRPKVSTAHDSLERLRDLLARAETSAATAST